MIRRRLAYSIVLVLVAVATPAALIAQTLWANVIPLPAGYVSNADTLISRAFDEALFTIGTADTPKRGKFSSGYLTRVPEGFHEAASAAWKKWEPVLKAKGWVLKGETGESYSLQRVEGATESWLMVGLAEYQDPRLTLVQLPAAPRKIDLPAPAAVAERVSAAQEWPFLKAVGGAKLENTATVDEPLDVTVAGADKEAHLVGRTYIVKQYTPPSSLSKLEFALTYRDALARAGWTVLPRGAGIVEGDGPVLAHYAANGRDIWASLGRANDDSNTGMSLAIADIGADDWAKALSTSCKLPLYGVTFDFDKATLKAESTPILEKAAAALKSAATLAIEVQGHTDDVGDDAYNMRLSAQRADAVRLWLTQHGIVATRLTSKGYGKSMPVVDNSSDGNRARNRRVELSCRK